MSYGTRNYHASNYNWLQTILTKKRFPPSSDGHHCRERKEARNEVAVGLIGHPTTSSPTSLATQPHHLQPRRPPNHVVSDLIGHPTNFSFDHAGFTSRSQRWRVAPQRVLAMIGDESPRSWGGGAHLCRRPRGIIVTCESSDPAKRLDFQLYWLENQRLQIIAILTVGRSRWSGVGGVWALITS